MTDQNHKWAHVPLIVVVWALARLALAAVAGLLMMVSGCGAPMRFDRVTAANSFEQDKYDCDAQLGYVGTGGVQPTDQLAHLLVSYRDDLTRCLERRGWKRVP